MARPRRGEITQRASRGDVYFVAFDPARGSEIQKTRPAVVVQNDIANHASPITIIAAITSHGEGRRIYPTDVPVRAGEGGLTSPSVVLLNQLRSVDRSRLIRRLGSLKPDTMKRINQALAISLGLVEL
jgi:mRNA interferase MazF